MKTINGFILLIFFLISVSSRCLADDQLDMSGKFKDYNVILIILDALRPDFLSCYGYPKKTTPNIDLLAQEGIVFNNAFSQASLTLPSVASIFTSLYPESHNFRTVFKDKMPEGVYTLAQIFTFYGYNTAWFGTLKDPHSGSAPGLLKGFKEKYDIVSDISSDKISPWIKKHRKTPFFITIHSYLSHEGTFPFRRFHNHFSDSISAGFRIKSFEIWTQWWEDLQSELQNNPDNIYKTFGEDWVKKHQDYFFRPLSKETLSRLYVLAETQERRHKLYRFFREGYLAAFPELDEEQRADFFLLLDSANFELDAKLIGPLLRDLQKLNLFSKTIIIITADHGNEFNEHGHIGHGQFLYDESIHVPLILYLPGTEQPLRQDGLVQSVDLLPSILDLIGIPVPYQAQGSSFVNILEGKPGNPDKFIFAQSHSGLLESIRSQSWKLIQHPGSHDQDELFYLKGDPLEKNNLIKKKAQMAEELKTELNNWKSGLTIYSQEKNEFSPKIDAETRENIRKTGYW